MELRAQSPSTTLTIYDMEHPPSPTAFAEASVFAEVYPPLTAPKATKATPDKMAVKKLRRTGWDGGRMPEDQ